MFRETGDRSCRFTTYFFIINGVNTGMFRNCILLYVSDNFIINGVNTGMPVRNCILLYVSGKEFLQINLCC